MNTYNIICNYSVIIYNLPLTVKMEMLIVFEICNSFARLIWLVGDSGIGGGNTVSRMCLPTSSFFSPGWKVKVFF